jgi:WhiB family redox-sensing transcriptional regulator
MTAYAPERPRILAELAERPGQTAFEVAAALGCGRQDGRRVARLVTRMWQRGDLAAGTVFRPLQGREARIFAVALPGTPPPPRLETAGQAEHRRALNRQQKAKERAAGQPKPPRAEGRVSLGLAVHQAACRRDPDLFFGPEHESPAARDRRVAKARAVCFSCPIRRRCLEAAEANGERFGIWGGIDFERRTPQATQPDVAASGRP